MAALIRSAAAPQGDDMLGEYGGDDAVVKVVAGTARGVTLMPPRVGKMGKDLGWFVPRRVKSLTRGPRGLHPNKGPLNTLFLLSIVAPDVFKQ
jgi:hypothetical protein